MVEEDGAPVAELPAPVLVAVTPVYPLLKFRCDSGGDDSRPEDEPEPPTIEDVPEPGVRVVDEEEPSAEDVNEDDDAEDDEPEDDVDVEGALELDEPGEPVLLLFVAPALELSVVLTTVVAGPVPAAGGAAAVTAGPPAPPPPPPLPPLEDRAAPTFGAGMFCPGGSQSADVLDGSGIRLPFRRDRLTYDRDDVKEALGIFLCSLLTRLGHQIQPLAHKQTRKGRKYSPLFCYQLHSNSPPASLD